MLAPLRSLAVHAAEPEDFRWVVRLDDGTDYPEIGPDGVTRGWDSVPHRHVVALGLIPQRDDLHPFAIPIDEHVVPVFFRRRQLGINGDSGEVTHQQTITVIGMEYSGVAGGLAKYWAFYPNGDTHCTTDKAAIQ